MRCQTVKLLDFGEDDAFLDAPQKSPNLIEVAVVRGQQVDNT